MDPEVYLPIVSIGDNLKPYYKISNYGKVINFITNTEIIPHTNDNGYLQVSLMTETGRVFRKVHRLLMMTFYYFEGCEVYQVNHKNGNKSINEYWNLEWSTPKSNIHHAIENGLRKPFYGENNPTAILNENDVRNIINMTISGIPDSIIVDNICKGNVSLFRSIIYGRTWRHIVTDDELNLIKSIRQNISDTNKHTICLFYQNHHQEYTGYGSTKSIVRDALNDANLDPDDEKLFRIAKRLFYKYDSPEITSKYIY